MTSKEIQALHKLIDDMAFERGHASNSREEVLIRLLLESIELSTEINKLAISVMATWGMEVSEDAELSPIEDEIADVYIMNRRLAKVLGVDSGNAIRDKLRKDEGRKYMKVV